VPVTVFEVLVLVLAIPGAVVALGDAWARRSLLGDAAHRRGSGERAYRRTALLCTIELAISIRFQIGRAHDGLETARTTWNRVP
jgi:hypothetical protein